MWNTDQGINLDVETAGKETDHLLVSGNTVYDDPGTSKSDPSTGTNPPGTGGTSTVAGHDPFALYIDAFGSNAKITDVYVHDNTLQNQSQFYLTPAAGMPVVDLGGIWSNVQIWHNTITGMGASDRYNPLFEVDKQPNGGTNVVDCNDYGNLSTAGNTVNGNFALPSNDWLTLADWQAHNGHGWDADSEVGGFSAELPEQVDPDDRRDAQAQPDRRVHPDRCASVAATPASALGPLPRASTASTPSLPTTTAPRHAADRRHAARRRHRAGGGPVLAPGAAAAGGPAAQSSRSATAWDACTAAGKCRAWRGHHGHPVRGPALRRRSRRYRQVPEGHRDRHRGGGDKSRDICVQHKQRLGERRRQQGRARLPGRAAAGQRVRERDAGAAHRVGGGVLQRGRAALQRRRRPGHPAVPGGPRALAADAGQPACSTPARCAPAGTGWRCAPPTGPARRPRRFAWHVVPMPAPLPCRAAPGRHCWYPPHLDSTGHPMRWDWQIGRVTPLQRTGARAVDIYDIDGFLTTAAEVRAIHTRWQAATLPHPKAVCYLDLAWEDYRPDGTPGQFFPAATLGNVYFGYPQERWVDFRQLDALKPMLDERIRMCAAKGFDAVELDDIDSFDPPSTTGFHLTPGDAQNYLAYAFNEIHRYGMTGLWKNSPLLSWWGRRYADGAVVEECYRYHAVLRLPAARQQPVRDHLHRAVRPDAVRLG